MKAAKTTRKSRAGTQMATKKIKMWTQVRQALQMTCSKRIGKMRQPLVWSPQLRAPLIWSCAGPSKLVISISIESRSKRPKKRLQWLKVLYRPEPHKMRSTKMWLNSMTGSSISILSSRWALMASKHQTSRMLNKQQTENQESKAILRRILNS